MFNTARNSKCSLPASRRLPPPPATRVTYPQPTPQVRDPFMFAALNVRDIKAAEAYYTKLGMRRCKYPRARVAEVSPFEPPQPKDSVYMSFADDAFGVLLLPIPIIKGKKRVRIPQNATTSRPHNPTNPNNTGIRPTTALSLLRNSRWRSATSTTSWPFSPMTSAWARQIWARSSQPAVRFARRWGETRMVTGLRCWSTQTSSRSRAAEALTWLT